ncbi:MAG: reverse transcriptase family protein [Phycisphaerae bacterium]
MSFQIVRMIEALAGALVLEEWSVRGIRAGLAGVGKTRGISTAGLAGGIIKAFPERPEVEALVAFLAGDEGLLRSMREVRAGLLKQTTMEKAPAGLRGIGVPAIATEMELAEWLGVGLGRLQWRADVQGRNRRWRQEGLWNYRYRWVEKRSGGGWRLLEMPRGELKRMQRRVLEEILSRVPVHEAVHGFRRGRSIVTNAAAHCGREVVVRFDLKDFFLSVTAGRVFGIFRTMGYPAGVARMLTGLCTTRLPGVVWEGRPDRGDGDFELRQRLFTPHLPQGAPTSPVLANLAALGMDRRLAGLAKAIGATCTRYADDLVFSGGEALGRDRKRLEPLVGAIAIEEGFGLNFRKTRVMRESVRQKVTGVVVNVRPNVGRAEFDRLKAILTNCVRQGAETQNREGYLDFRAHLAGRVAQVAGVHLGRGEKLRRLFERIEWPAT